MKTTDPDKARQRKALLITGAIFLLLLLAVGALYIVHQSRTIKGLAQQGEIDKILLKEDYDNLAQQYEGYKFTVENDSLVAKLASEQAKVQRLLEELRTVKATDARRIAELRRELHTLREILRSYVIQIDSLNAANEQLRTENQQVKEEISRVSTQRNRLEAERIQLSKQVELAAKLSASGLQVMGLNSRGKTTKNINQMTQLRVTFNIDRNITTDPGIKPIYVRLYKPDDELMTKPDSGTFSFEGGEIPYSMVREIEYEGESVGVTLYWNINEYLMKGRYRAEVFADGYLIGKSSFTL